ncbi:MAG: sugar phosphate isomerase/epimerase family protein, partial [Anaerolineae bacterium]|nr:sugar phosphate isomerase/epimerase family protein [Anaerolineae bacterium]
GNDWAPFGAMLERFQRWGYDGVELAVRDPASLDVAALERSLRGARLPVVALATGTAYSVDGLSFVHPDAEVRRAARQRVADHCRLAARIGGYVILGLVRGRVVPGVSREQAVAWLEEGVAAACEDGVRLGVRLLFEPINRYEADLVHTAEEGLALLDRLSATNLGLLLDTFHMNIEEADICQSLRRAGPRVQHVHAADSNRCYPGAGHVDFTAVVAALREVGYAGYLSAEVLPRPDLVTSLERAAGYLRRLLGRQEQ